MEYGTLELLWYPYESTSLDRALDALEAAWALSEAGDADPKRTALGINLAAALILKAERDSVPRDLLQALDVLSSLPTHADGAVLYNRAWVLTRLGIRSEGEAAWREYLRFDGTSPWATDAQRAIDSLGAADDGSSVSTMGSPALGVSPEVVADPQGVREALLGDGLLRAAADRRWDLLREARSWAGGLEDKSVAHTIDALLADTSQAAPVTTALRRYTEGIRLRSERVYDGATQLLDEVSSTAEFSGLRAVAGWARVEAGSSLFAANDYRGADARFQSTLERVDLEMYPSLRGRALWGVGMVSAREGRPEAALEALTQAAEAFETAGEGRNAAFLHSSVARMYRELGRERDAWPHYLRSIRELGRLPASTRLHSALWELSEAAQADGLQAAAIALQRIGVGVAERTGEPWAIAEALVHLARRLQRSDPGASVEVLLRARSQAEEIADSVGQSRAIADVLETLGSLSLVATDQRMAALDSAVAYYESAGNRINLISVYEQRATIARDSGDLTRARRELDLAIGEVENQRSTLSRDQLRTGFATVWQRVFDARAAVEVDRDPWAALAFIERSREIHLGPMPAAPQRGHGNENSILLQYAEVDGVLHRWVMVDSARVHLALGSADSIRALVESARTGLLDARSETRSGAGAIAALSKVLLPWDDAVSANRGRVLLVSDAILEGFPFQTLVWRDGVPVVEASTVALYHSFERAASAAPTVRPWPLADALIVGRPALGPDAARLPDLPAAEVEARRVARLVPGSTLLLGRGATRAAVVPQLDRHTVFHFAGHAVPDPDHPSASFLALAGVGSVGMDRLFGAELLDRRFERLRLVVLSACATGSGGEARSGGLWALAGPFLFAGVDAVVATLWPVDDVVATEFSTVFYAELAGGAAVDAAIARARRALLASGDPRMNHPRGWAAFQLFGT